MLTRGAIICCTPSTTRKTTDITMKDQLSFSTILIICGIAMAILIIMVCLCSRNYSGTREPARDNCRQTVTQNADLTSNVNQMTASNARNLGQSDYDWGPPSYSQVTVGNDHLCTTESTSGNSPFTISTDTLDHRSSDHTDNTDTGTSADLPPSYDSLDFDVTSD